MLVSGLAGVGIEVGWATVQFLGLFFVTLVYQRTFVHRRVLWDPETCSSLHYGDYSAAEAVVRPPSERVSFCAAVREEIRYVS
jgi:hypothetical protein